MLANIIRRLLRRRADNPTEHQSRNSPPQSKASGWIEQALHLQEIGSYPALIALCESVLARETDNVDALQLSAVALCASGRTRDGVARLRRLTELAPASADAHITLANVLAATGEADAAIASYRRAVALKPQLADAWSRLGALLKVLGRYDEAEESCRSGLSDNPRNASLYHTLSGALFEQGRVDEAVVAVRTCLEIAPELHEARSDLVRMLNYVDGISPAAVFDEHRGWGERHANALAKGAAPHANDPAPDRQLRVGFVSPYFRKHAMTFFFESVAEHHDRDRMEMFLFADVAQPDEYSERLKAYGAIWRPTVGLDDRQLADAVRKNEIDVLVDLSGHTPYNRLLAFARRPAPVQVTWNGYPNTTGMSAMDYRITDANCDPPGTTENLHSERLVRLPQIYMTWRPPLDAPHPGNLPCGHDGPVTFASFNSCFKITPTVVALWARILHEVHGAKLLLLTITSRGAQDRVRRLFSEHGIGPDRIELVPRLSHEEFLETHRRVDIALDAYPYHGTTTTCFSLWMGVPVVVLAGTTHVSRVGVSLLGNIAMEELIARNGDEYVAVAKKLASDRPTLATLRSRLRQRMLDSPITDGRAGAHALEHALRQMWSDWCAKRGAAR